MRPPELAQARLAKEIAQMRVYGVEYWPIFCWKTIDPSVGKQSTLRVAGVPKMLIDVERRISGGSTSPLSSALRCGEK
jgi:hypothetical protein